MNLNILMLIITLGSTPAMADELLGITSVEPAKGPVQGGTEITIKGSGFASDASVKVGGYPCADVAITGTVKITCKTPENIARKTDVTVINGDGTAFNATGAFGYAGVPTFQLLQKRVFTRFGINSQGVTVVYKCSGCHSGASPDGKFDSRDYGQVLGHVVPRDPAASKLLKLLSDGKMPPIQRQPALKAEEIQAVSDWINDGARNN